MNRYPVWKFAIIVIALLLGVVYTLPNFFGEAPAVQVSSSKMSAKVDAAALARVEDALKAANVVSSAVTLEGNSIRARFESTEQQLKAKDAIQKALIPEGADNGYVVALNLLSRSPAWLSALHASPMYLGLDLRGGVHFMLQVDMKAALTQKTDSLAGDIRTTLREKDVRHGGITRNGPNIEIKVRDQAQLDAVRRALADQFADLQVLDAAEGGEFKITANIKPEAARRVQEQALKQNITTLHNRINELGVAGLSFNSRALTALWCNCLAFKTRPRPKIFWAAQPPWKFAWSTRAAKRALQSKPMVWCPLGLSVTWSAMAKR